MQDHSFDPGRSFYKPFATRAPVLIFLLLCTLGLIALSEVACRSLPNHQGVGRLSKVADELNQTLNLNVGRSLVRRQWSTIDSTDIVLNAMPSATSPPAEPLMDPTPSSSSEYHGGTSTVAEGHLPLGDGTLPTPPPDPASTVAEGHLPIGGGSQPTPPPDPTPLPDTGSGITTVVPIPTEGYLDPDKPTPAVIPPGAVNSLIDTVNGQTSTLTPPVPMPSSGISSAPFVAIIDGKESTLSAGQAATATNGEPLPIVTEINGNIYTLSPTGTFSSSRIGNPSKTNAAVVPTATFVNSTGTYLTWSNGGITRAPQIVLIQYICVAFVPLILAVIFTIPWRILDSTVRELEPFFQLARPGGALAEHSLCLNYGASFLITTPFKAVFRGHFIVFWSSLISMAVLLLAPLSSEAFFVSLSGKCGANITGSCHAAWGVYPSLVRAIQGILSFVAVLLVLLLGFTFNRKSGVFSEPLSIVGLASLLYKSPALKDFREIDSLVKNSELKSILSGRRYALSHFTGPDHRPCYGIVNVNTDVETGFAVKAGRAHDKGHYKLVAGSKSNVVTTSEEASMNFTRSRGAKVWWVVKEKLYYVAAFILLGGLLALISYYHWTSGDTGFERFMDSEGFGVRFMMTGLGVAVKLFWSGIDQDLRKLAPFSRLLQGSSHPNDSVLVPFWPSPFSAIIPSLRRGHYFVALICFVSLLSEFLPICLANISFSPAITKQTYEICNAISMGVLILMVGCILFLIFRPMRGRPLPRSPGTVASVGIYLAGRESEWVGDGHGGLMDGLEGVSLMERKERDESIREKGVLYAIGVVNGDGLRIDDDRRISRLWAD